MITFSQIKNRLGDALNDLGEALTAALEWIEEGDTLQTFTSASKKLASHVENVAPAPAQWAGHRSA